ncbi:MAG TPA: IclR family transcriptional regulator [Acidimicrobiales bacterium]|nr:IclR family transcriptional regulator [Acidimicrobiales bacterium]
MGDSLQGAASLGKAVSVLDSLASSGPLSLAGLVSATGIPRATAYRLATALVAYGLVDKGTDGTYRLGGRLVELGRLAGQRRRGLAEAAAPVLERLRDRTGESAQLFVAEGDRRVCIVSLESPHSLRTIVVVGASLPMDRGSAAHVLAGDPATLAKGWCESIEERELGVASVSAPVYLDGSVVAAVSVSGPIERTTRSPGDRYAIFVVEAAGEVSLALH